MKMTDNGPVVAKSIRINDDFSWQLHIHQKMVHLESLEVSLPCSLVSISAFKEVFSNIVGSNICCGNPDEKFHSLAHSRKGVFLNSKG
jgi:hypothetical protein